MRSSDSVTVRKTVKGRKSYGDYEEYSATDDADKSAAAIPEGGIPRPGMTTTSGQTVDSLSTALCVYERNG